MALDTTTPRTRRALLAAGLGGLAATLASALGRPQAVRAADADYVRVGYVLEGANTTKISIPTPSYGTIWGENTATSGNGAGLVGSAESADGYGVLGRSANGNATGVYGQSTNGSGVHGTGGSRGVGGDSDTGIGVRGDSLSGIGVLGNATTGTGVRGETGTGGQSAVIGYATADGTGILGFSSPSVDEAFPVAPPRTGVFGQATLFSTSRGVWGKSAAGQGVRGEATTGVGVYAVATTGAALQVAGRSLFSRSGRASVPINRRYVDVTVPGGLASSANVLATLQALRSGVYVAAVRTNYPTTGKARIYLNKVASTTVKTPVAWFVLG